MTSRESVSKALFTVANLFGADVDHCGLGAGRVQGGISDILG
ncbi:MAG: hypothetical protein ACI8RZ_001837 [Myxococcota bacterium]|jgi:hypothetical protein